MSKLIPHRHTRRIDGPVRRYRAELLSTDFGQPSVSVTLGDGTTGTAMCLGCHDTPCMSATDVQPLPAVLSDFPADPSSHVCPTDAIHWSADAQSAIVDEGSCIGCGLCAARCPYGAITLDSSGTAIVQIDDVDRVTGHSKSALGPHPTPKRVGVLGKDSPKLHNLPEVIAALPSATSARFVCNVLAACGINPRVRRTGDQNVRMDGVYQLQCGDLGPLEIGLGSDTLEPLRALLEDVAVLHNRFGVPRTNLLPLAVLVALPSMRSEYYRLVSDIKTVTRMEARTATLGVLISLMWQFIKIDDLNDGLFFVHEGQKDLWGAIAAKWPNARRHQLSQGGYSPARPTP